MARIISNTGAKTIALSEGWQLASTSSGEFVSPADLDRKLAWVDAEVPGTVAAALSQSGQWTLDRPTPLADKDFWYRVRFPGRGAVAIRFEGLATLAEVWLNGAPILASNSMFLAHDIDVDLAGDNDLHICFRALAPFLEKFKADTRARWRSPMIGHQNLRAIRTTLLGHMPGWCPPVDAVGPWRPINVAARGSIDILSCDARASLSGSDGHVEARMVVLGDMHGAVLEVGDFSGPLAESQANTWTGRVTIPDVERWWPHTHGRPALYPVRVRFGDITLDLGMTGFRSLEVDRGPDGAGFGLRINGVPVFCRGAVWMNASVVALPCSRDAYRPWLEQMRDASLNMVRVAGTTVYEAKDFHDICDELGILVWQDFMFANMDYPGHFPPFGDACRAEARQVLDRIQLSPSLAVLCGGSEVFQQAAMLGMRREVLSNPLFDEILPDAVASLRPDVPYVANSPSGGDLPFSVGTGITHYFGVGAYLRPLDDARRSNVRFASECLAFANIPHEVTVERALPEAGLNHPRWKERTPRDAGATWDFEDVRDHYIEALYRIDARDLRSTDPQRYTHASRAVVARIVETTLGEWRRSGSSTSGALILALQDLWPGAGWGLIDSCGEPKSALFALRRACQPLQIALTDEGLDGLAIHLVNEAPGDRRLHVSLVCLRDGRVPVIKANATLELKGRASHTLSSAAMIGGFYDITNSYRFGPLGHDVSVVTLIDAETNERIGEAFHVPDGLTLQSRDLGLKATLARLDDECWDLEVSCTRFAQAVHIYDRAFRPDDDYFHLSPLAPRRIRLRPRNPRLKDMLPEGEISALNGTGVSTFDVTS